MVYYFKIAFCAFSLTSIFVMFTDDICSYFGVKVGLYFAWLGHYTMALCVPALIGSLLWLGLLYCGQTIQDIGTF